MLLIWSKAINLKIVVVQMEENDGSILPYE